MDFLMLMTGGLVLIILYYVTYTYQPVVFGTKKYSLAKFMLYKGKILKLNSELANLVTSYDAGYLNAFSDSDISFSEIIEALNEKFNIEFSEMQLQRVNENKMSKSDLTEFIERMDHQMEIINTLQSSLKSRMSYNTPAIA